MTPAISVVVPTYNRPEMVADCLAGFAAQTVPREAFEVVVVDDGSETDPSAALEPLAEAVDLRLERRDHGGAAAARNVGVVLARAPLIVLFDDDQRPLPTMIERCLAFHEAEPDEGAFRLLRVVPPEGPRDAASLAMFEGQGAFHYPQPGHDLGYSGFWGGAVTCKASIFRYGLYDPAYGMVEDVELGLRIHQWLPLRCRHDGVPDAVQLRSMTVREMASRWLRLSYFHLHWQRNYPNLVEIGQWPVYRDAEKIAARARPLPPWIDALDEQARGLGTLPPQPWDEALMARLRPFLQDILGLLRACQATAWLSARRDETVEELLARELP